MTLDEFENVMTYIGLAVRDPLPAEAMVVYFDIFGGFDAAELRAAARRAILNHRWPTFPTAAELWAATQPDGLTGVEAWRIAADAIANIDPEIRVEYWRNGKRYPSQAAAFLEGLPERVVETIKAMGIPALCYSKDPVGMVQARFVKFYGELGERDRRQALMPPAMKTIGGRMPALVQGIGRTVEGES